MWQLVIEEIISHVRCINVDEELVTRFENTSKKHPKYLSAVLENQNW